MNSFGIACAACAVVTLLTWGYAVWCWDDSIARGDKRLEVAIVAFFAALALCLVTGILAVFT